jgi:phosphoribosylformimino-5-aminoimidazole carboxamide ribotide isomerase
MGRVSGYATHGLRRGLLSFAPSGLTARPYDGVLLSGYVTMLILPAIDLISGRCVRLRQGDYEQVTVFGDDPAAVASGFRDAGAKWLHLVDLDGARLGTPQNLASIERVVAAVGGSTRSRAGMKIEVGGGIRRTEDIARLLEMGVGRAIVGTRGVREPEWLKELAGLFPQRIALGLDGKDGRVAIKGWQETTASTVAELVKSVAGLKLAAIIYTDIAKDGMMSGPNVEATAALAKASPFPVIASGGVTTVDDVRRLKASGVHGAIIGRALYEGTITVEAAIEAAGPQE